MIEDAGLRQARFAALQRPSGTLALLALDQRESLRTMLERAGRPAEGRDVSAFKVEAARALSPLASGLLIDPELGLGPVLEADALAPDCGLIVAVDRLVQPRGGIVEETEFDDEIDMPALVAAGAVAFKLLVLWRRDDDRDARSRMVETFVRRCAEAGALSLVEGVVRPRRDGGPGDREADVLEAARDLAALRPDIYKAEVPTLGEGPPDEIEERSRAITDVLDMPWVVLSAGVDADVFPAAVRAACRGGASGFLAGRGIWARTISDEGDLVAGLRAGARDRLTTLTSIVDAAARPWAGVIAEAAAVG